MSDKNNQEGPVKNQTGKPEQLIPAMDKGIPLQLGSGIAEKGTKSKNFQKHAHNNPACCRRVFKLIVLNPWKRLLLPARCRNPKWNRRASPLHNPIDKACNKSYNSQIRYYNTKKYLNGRHFSANIGKKGQTKNRN